MVITQISYIVTFSFLKKKTEEIIKHPRIYLCDSEIDIQKTKMRNTEKIQVGRHST